MYTDVQIINQGLGKLSSTTIKSIAPPSTPLEHFMLQNYDAWKRVELAKRRWVFATVFDYEPAKVDTLTTNPRDGRIYKYELPAECLRPLRNDDSEWVQRKRFLYSAIGTNFRIDYIDKVDENEFDPLFVEVLACKIAKESAEKITQSNTKKDTLEMWYDKAVHEASLSNAFVQEPHFISDADSRYSWVSDRW